MVFSQTDKTTIYIILEKNIDFEIVKSTKNDSIIERYFFNVDKNSNPNIKLEIDKDGSLNKKITLVSSKNKLIFDYFNFNKKNEPKLISSEEVKNVISLTEIKYKIDFNNLSEVLKEVKSIYLISEVPNFEGYYLSKKVDFFDH
jgi:hypothetical protein